MKTCYRYRYEFPWHRNVALSRIFKTPGGDPKTTTNAMLFLIQTLYLNKRIP